MGLGGFLAGLSQASNQLPQAIQNRQMLGVREEEAEARKLAAQRQSQKEIVDRLVWMAETGETEAVTQAVKVLPEGFMPGLAPALIGRAEDAAFKNNQESDKRTIDNQYKQAQKMRLEAPPWQSTKDSQWMHRTNLDGELEQTLGPSPDPKPPKVLQLVASEGAILNEDGTTTLIADKKVRDALIASAKTKNPATRWENGLVWFRNGSSRPWTNLEKQIYFDFETEKAKQSYAHFTEREDYRNKLLLGRYEAQAKIQLGTEEKKREWDRLDEQSKTIETIFNLNLVPLQKGFETPDRSIGNAKQQLELAQIDPQRISTLLQEWEPIYNSYAFQFNLTSAQAGLVMENRGIQVSADKIYELLKDDDVKKHIGVFKGRFEDFSRSFKGGEGTPQSVVNFRFELNNMVDAVRRARTGAAISATEEHFYNDLLGTTRFEAGYLQDIMESLVTSIDSQSEQLYLGLWQQKYQYPATGEDLEQIREKLLYKTNIGAPDPKTKLQRVSVGQVKGNDNGN